MISIYIYNYVGQCYGCDGRTDLGREETIRLTIHSTDFSASESIIGFMSYKLLALNMEEEKVVALFTCLCLFVVVFIVY